MNPRSGPFGREDLLRRTLPFGAIIVIAFAAVALPPGGDDWLEIGVAGAITLLLVGTVAGLPWQRLPLAAQAVPPLAFLIVVALLRDSQGGATSGYAPLVMLPILWLALYGSRAQVVVAVLGAAAVVLVPPVVANGAAYPDAEFRRAAILAFVAALTGLTVQQLVVEVRRRAADSAELAARLGNDARRLAATVTRVTREIADAESPRESICRATRELSGCRVAALVEPADEGQLMVTACAGAEAPSLRLAVGEEPSGVAVAMTSRKAFLVTDARDHPAVSAKEVDLAGGSSLLFEPVLQRDEVLGALLVGWEEEVESLSEWRALVVPLLAAEAAMAIERAELIPRLTKLARIDALTGLPNRYVWEEELPRELARSARTLQPISVAMLDIDHFKAFNDRHGHQAGDQLLKESAAAWQGSLREYDLLARYGGEEFAAIIYGAGLEQALEIVDRLRGRTPQGQTCSAGVACWSGQETPEQLVGRADEALYAAKESGRDCAMVSNGSPGAM